MLKTIHDFDVSENVFKKAKFTQTLAENCENLQFLAT